ncbi:MAG TPA: hypothetical protein VGC40_08965 [Paenirhodobacter sp.]
MDRISGVLPQVGWTPSQMPIAAAKPPASTVEPATAISSARSGMDAGVDTQTPEDRASQAQSQIHARRASTVHSESAVLAQSQTINPDAPSGPRPTFEISPMEVRVAQLSAPPEMNADIAPEPADNTAVSALSTQNAKGAKQAHSSPTVVASATVSTQGNQIGWQSLDTATQGQSLDLLR